MGEESDRDGPRESVSATSVLSTDHDADILNTMEVRAPRSRLSTSLKRRSSAVSTTTSARIHMSPRSTGGSSTSVSATTSRKRSPHPQSRFADEFRATATNTSSDIISNRTRATRVEVESSSAEFVHIGALNVPTPPLVSNMVPSEGVTSRMFSDSQWEREIAEFGRILDDMLARVTCRELVKKTAEYMKKYPHHSVRFQIKMKQRAYSEATKQFQAKLMLFYVLHEFLKSFQGDELRNIQREWFQTVDEILHACVREMRGVEDGRKRLFKTLARWEELKLYTQKIRGWKSLVMGEVKPRRAPVRLPRSEAERLAEVPDQLQQFPPPSSLPQLQIDRSTYPFLFERSDFQSRYDLKQHWRYTAVAFIDVLAQCLGLSREIALTASIFFHRVFDRGIYAQERYKFAAACIFLAAKAASKRMKLLRMVRTMHEILETPLLIGDEEILDLERMQLLYYEIEVLQGINFELTTEMPFYYLRRTLEQMPDKFRSAIMDDAHSVLEDLFWLPICLTFSPQFLAEAAAYIACRNNDRIFSFKWCHENSKGEVLTERTAKNILKDYRLLADWRKAQRKHFDALVKTSGSAGGRGPWNVKEVFASQQGGLRVDVSTFQNELEYTKKGVNESKATMVTTVYGEDESSRTSYRDDGSTSKYSTYSGRSSSTTITYRRRNDASDTRNDVKIKQEAKSQISDRGDYRNRNRERDSDRGRDRDRDRNNERYRTSRSRSSSDRTERQKNSRSYDNESRRSKERKSDIDDSMRRNDEENSSRGRTYDRNDENNHGQKRYRDYDRSRNRDYDRSRGEEYSSRDYERGRKREKEYDNNRDDYDRGRNRDKDYDRSKSDYVGDRNRDKGHDQDRTLNKDYDDYDRNRRRDKDYDRSTDYYDRDRSRDKDYERSRDDDDRDRSRDKDYDRSRRDYDRDRSRDRDYDRDRRSQSPSPRKSFTSSSSRKRRRNRSSESRSSSPKRSNSRDYQSSSAYTSRSEQQRTSSSSRSSRTDSRRNLKHDVSSRRDDDRTRFKQERDAA